MVLQTEKSSETYLFKPQTLLTSHHRKPLILKQEQAEPKQRKVSNLRQISRQNQNSMHQSGVRHFSQICARFTIQATASPSSLKQCTIPSTWRSNYMQPTSKYYHQIWWKWKHRLLWNDWRDGHLWRVFTSFLSAIASFPMQHFLAVAFDASWLFLRTLCNGRERHFVSGVRRTSNQSCTLICCKCLSKVQSFAPYIGISQICGPWWNALLILFLLFWKTHRFFIIWRLGWKRHRCVNLGEKTLQRDAQEKSCTGRTEDRLKMT